MLLVPTFLWRIAKNYSLIIIKYPPYLKTSDPRHDKTNECTPSEDSDQPGHLPSLIRVFAVRMKKPWVLSYPLSTSEDSDQTGRMLWLIGVFAGRTLILFVLPSRGSSCPVCKFMSDLESPLYVT